MADVTTFSVTPTIFTTLEASAVPMCQQGFRALGLGFRVQGLGFRALGLGFRVQGLGSRVRRAVSAGRVGDGYTPLS